jgi:hypothetical protein
MFLAKSFSRKIKKIKFSSALVLSLCLAAPAVGNAQSNDDGQPEKVNESFKTAYIPDGFDSNDKVEIVGEGVFRNSCYREAFTNAKLDREKKVITVDPKAYRYESPLCLTMLVPYKQVIDLGVLDAGDYTLKQESGETLGSLNVRAATNSSPDDHLYAPISQAYLGKADSGQWSVYLEGEFSNNCLELVDIMIDIQPKVIVVQPIAELTSNTGCEQGKFPFSANKVIESSKLERKRYLLHVRTLNANSVNNLVEVY